MAYNTVAGSTGTIIMNNDTLKINLVRQKINYYLFGQETFTL